MRVNKPTVSRISEPLFTRDNYIWMMIGAVINAVGLLLMSGGKNPADQFDYNVIYSARRITIAPILILIGFAVEVYAIFKKPRRTVAE